MKRIVILFPILLSACSILHTSPKPEPLIAPRVEYIIKVPPAELMRLPAKQDHLNVDDPNIKQSDVSRWVESSESYTTQLENQLIGIAQFFNSEQQKLDDQAKKENSK